MALPSKLTLHRPHMVENRGETWRPPVFRPLTSVKDQLVARVRRFLDLQAGSIWTDLSRLLPHCQGQVLDVGSGAQPYRPLLHPNAQYHAVDSSRSEQDFGYAMPETTYYTGDTWPVPDSSVDVVLCTETLEHVPDPGTFLAQAARCVRPGGHLLLTVPFAARWHYIPYDYWRYTPSGLDRLLNQAGFTQVAVYARGNAATVACYKLMALFLPLLFSRSPRAWVRRLSMGGGLLAMPLVMALAFLGQISLRLPGGDDCLGYTVVATRRLGAGLIGNTADHNQPQHSSQL